MISGNAHVCESGVMSDTTGEIAALSDKMGTAVRHRFKQTMERWGKKGYYRQRPDAPLTDLEDGVWRAGA